MKKAKAEAATIKLDFSYGDPPAGALYVRPKGFDPLSLSWKLKDASVEEAYSAYLFQHVPAAQRGPLMDELHRVLIPGGKAVIIVPYYTSVRAIQDPTAEWPPLAEQSFLYFNKKFREDNKFDGPMTCDFDFVYGYTWDPDTASRADDVRAERAKHYTNAIIDLQIILTKR